MDAIPWYKSPQQISNAVGAVSMAAILLPKVAAYFGLTSPDAISQTVNGVFAIAALLAPIVGSILRARSPIQPLTLTQSAADNHPATLANVAKPPGG